MTPDERAFLDAIEKCPGDDDARRVYADYLDEQGFPHEAAWQRAGARMTGTEFHACNVAQDDDNDYAESGYVAVVVERQGLPVALLGHYSHCSCYGTWEDLCWDGISDHSGGVMKRPKFQWVGSADGLVALARSGTDPVVPGRPISDGDCDADHLRAVYAQVLDWDAKGRPGPKAGAVPPACGNSFCAPGCDCRAVNIPGA